MCSCNDVPDFFFKLRGIAGVRIAQTHPAIHTFVHEPCPTFLDITSMTRQYQSTENPSLSVACWQHQPDLTHQPCQTTTLTLVVQRTAVQGLYLFSFAPPGLSVQRRRADSHARCTLTSEHKHSAQCLWELTSDLVVSWMLIWSMHIQLGSAWAADMSSTRWVLAVASGLVRYHSLHSQCAVSLSIPYALSFPPVHYTPPVRCHDDILVFICVVNPSSLSALSFPPVDYTLQL